MSPETVLLDAVPHPATEDVTKKALVSNWILQRVSTDREQRKRETWAEERTWSLHL